MNKSDDLSISAALATLRSGLALNLRDEDRTFLIEPCDIQSLSSDTSAYLMSNRLARTLGKENTELPLNAPLVISNTDMAISEDAKKAVLFLLKAAHLVPLAKISKSSETKVSLSLVQAVKFSNQIADIQPSREVRLPTADAAIARAFLYVDHFDSKREHMALVMGEDTGEPPVVRVHSKCLTGDVFGSLRCDCGEQLTKAKTMLADAPYGILIYLDQEGRGIGLRNKLSAYNLQDEGFDTFEANHQLGYESDERTYETATAILKHLSVTKLKLLTNNPDKIGQLSGAVQIVERIALSASEDPNRTSYMQAKKASGHLI